MLDRRLFFSTNAVGMTNIVAQGFNLGRLRDKKIKSL